MFDVLRNVLRNCKIIDLSHPLNQHTPTWEGSCGFKEESAIYSNSGVNFNIKRLSMKAGIGTHMDAPFHCFQDGLSIDKISLENCVVPLHVIDVKPKMHPSYQLSVEDIKEYERKVSKIHQNSFVIIDTGWSKRWLNSEAYRGLENGRMMFPSISAEAALFLLEKNIVGLGVDTLSPDLEDTTFPVHRHLLGAGKYLIENIRKPERLPLTGAYLIALPLPFFEGTESPLRLVALAI